MPAIVESVINRKLKIATGHVKVKEARHIVLIIVIYKHITIKNMLVIGLG